MEFKKLFEEYANSIRKRLREIIQEKKEDYDNRIGIEIDVFDTLENFSTKGKMIRGSLFLFSAETYGKKIDEKLLNIACSLELMHSALLIHDDIMDNDELRRGDKTVFAQYRDLAYKLKLKNPEHFGISMGIVVGDIALFIAEEVATYSDETYLKKLLHFYTKELRLVGIGQLLDYSFGAKDLEVESEDIRKMYINKSARYSFSLPLGLGAISAGVSNEQIKIIEKLGEKIGLIFQLIDDDIGMFGTEEEIGKSIGSDIRENKKTFMRSLLIENSDENTKKIINNIFGKNEISNEEIETVRTLIKKFGVKDKIYELIDGLYKESFELVKLLRIDDKYKKIYLQLLDYNLNRKN